MESGCASVYIMLMTVVFYTTGSICALRLASRLATQALLPILSRILSHCYSLAATAVISGAACDLPTLSKVDSRDRSVSDAVAGLFFKLVHTARQDDFLVAGPPHAATITESTTSGRTTLVLFSAFVGACGIAAAYPKYTRTSS